MAAPLRRTLALVMAAIAALAVVACTSLVFMTTWLHHATTTLAASVESVRLVQEAQLDLLSHERTEDVASRHRVEIELLHRLDELSPVVVDPDGMRLTETAKAGVRAYLSAPHDDGAAELRAKAHGSLDDLVGWTVDEARSAEADARMWDRLGNVVGIGTGAMLAALTVLLVCWLRDALDPIVALSRVIARFTRGERDARAEERGPLEIRDIAERFNEMATTLTAKRDEQVAFLAGVAHDLRSPLSALSMSVALLTPPAGVDVERRVSTTAAMIGRQVARLDRMIGDLLEVAKIEAGHLSVQLDAHDIGRVVEETVELFQATTPERTIRLSLGDRSLRVRCDPMRIEQVVSNLVSNAIKYSPSGRDVEVAVYRQGADAVIAVTDHGIGISAEDQDRLFEPFRRVGLSKETIPGVGLGLFVVRRIVEAHGGRVEVDSTPGRGSRFRVRLPLGSSPTEQERP